jgi:hypothetical protein
MGELANEIYTKRNQHLRTAHLMRFLFTAYSAFIVGYLLLALLGLLGSWRELLGFAAFCFAATIIYVSMKGGYRQYKRHIELSTQLNMLQQKAKKVVEHKTETTDLDTLSLYKNLEQLTDIEPSLAGKFLAFCFR